MADVTIRFRFNAKTGKRELVIAYESDSDVLPHEHEKDHRALAEELLGMPLGDDVGEVVVERVAKKGAAADEEGAAAGERSEGVGTGRRGGGEKDSG